MKFRDYILAHDFELKAVADDIGVAYQAVFMWFRGQRIPGKENMKAIYIWSAGLVQPNDFYDLPDLNDPAAVLQDAHRGNGACVQNSGVAA